MPAKFIQSLLLTLLLNCFVGYSYAKQNTPEQLAIDNERIIRIALPDQASIQAASPERFNQLVNFLKEFWQIWAIDNQQSIEFYYLPTVLALEQLHQSKIDIVSINVFQQKDHHFLYSIPYVTYKRSLYRNINSNGTDGTQLGIHSQDKSILSFLPSHIDRDYFSDADELLKAYNDYDAIYSAQPWIIEKKLEEHGLRQQFFKNQTEIPQVNFHFTTRNNDRALLKVINSSIRAIKPTQASAWSEKYQLNFSSNFTLTLGKYLPYLSEQEQEYLLDHNIIYYPITHDGFPPFIITKNFSNITERGFVTELINYATEKLGVRFQPIYVDDVDAMITHVETNQAQLLVNIERNKQREAQFHFSNPYLKAHYSLALNPKITSIDRISDIRKLKVAAVKNYSITTLLKNKFPSADILTFDTITKALSAVADGNADTFIGHSLTTSYWIKQHRLSNLTTQPINIFNSQSQYFFATTPQHQPLVSLLNKAIKSLPADQFDTMYAKWSQSAFPNTDIQAQVATAYRQASYVFFAILLIALIIFWVYYRQLQVRKIAQRKIEHALAIAEAARKEAENSAQAKITFLTQMSHEIRTPMNGVLGMTEALNFTKLNTEQSELLETLENSARHLLALLNDVLDFSKMDAGKLTLESVPVNFHLLAKNTIKSFKHVESHNNLSLILDIDDDITHTYYTDPTRLNQVLNNLVSNAIKFTEHGSITLTIKRSAQTKRDNGIFDTLDFAVKDTGIGISQEKQELLFTPFIQADSDTTRKYGGTGLGLSICQEIITAMGSKISLSSQENKGSKFCFSLTLKQAGFEAESEDRRKNNRTANAPHDDRFASLNVLIAEDNLVNVKVLSAQLARLNIDADIAYDGAEALAKHQQSPYDIIISDCHMPNMDGFELAEQIKADLSQNIWLIAVTADALTGAADKCLAAGFDDYMAKPCPQEEITNKLNHAYRELTKQKSTTKPTSNDQ